MFSELKYEETPEIWISDNHRIHSTASSNQAESDVVIFNDLSTEIMKWSFKSSSQWSWMSES